MNQGRLHSPGMVWACLLAACALPLACRGADDPGAVVRIEAPTLQMSWDSPDHVSGVYHVKDQATISVLVDNPTGLPLELSGEIAFGPVGRDGQVTPVSVTPIQAATLGPGQHAKIPLQLTFGAAGGYGLEWKHESSRSRIVPPAGVDLQCIFAPRPAAGDLPWLAVLPPAAVRVPGYLPDYIQRTTVRRFLIDERFGFDARTNVGLGFGASTGTGAREVDQFLAEAAQARARLVLRVAVPLDEPMAGGRTLEAFKTYLVDAVRRSRGTLEAVAIVPAGETFTDAQRTLFRSFYLGGYEAVKRADRTVMMLGAGSAAATRDMLVAHDPVLLGYVDALALADAALEPPIAAEMIAASPSSPSLPASGPARRPPALPTWILPAPPGLRSAPPAAALARHGVVVPVPAPAADNGVTAHLLNGAVLQQRLELTVPRPEDQPQESSRMPFIAVFQGDGYAVAAVAGLSAGTDVDATFPLLARTRTVVEPEKPDGRPSYPSIEVGDDTHSMRVVDAMGLAVDCRFGGDGDSLFVPAGENVVYILQAGNAEDLAGTLHPAAPNCLPLFQFSVRPGAKVLTVRAENVSVAEQGGTVRVISPVEGGEAVLLGEKDFPPISPGKAVELPVELSGVPGDRVVIEALTTGSKPQVQRTVLTLR